MTFDVAARFFGGDASLYVDESCSELEPLIRIVESLLNSVVRRMMWRNGMRARPACVRDLGMTSIEHGAGTPFARRPVSDANVLSLQAG